MSDKLNATTHVLQGKDELVTSYFGTRTDPVTGKTQTTHGGIDLISAGGNRTVIAFADGVVTATRNTYKGKTTDGSAGNYITVAHGGGMQTKYKHLKKDSLKVKKGETVKAGQPLATMGCTGHATGVHLHFDVVIDGERVNPLPYLRGEHTKCTDNTVHGNRGDKPTVVWGNTYDKEVKAIQQWMNKHKNARILADGMAGNRTLKYCKKYTVKKNADGEVSKWVQQRLKTLGYYTGCVDGEPRSLTEKAIKAFEQAYGLTVNGNISGNDWYYLLAAEV